MAEHITSALNQGKIAPRSTLLITATSFDPEMELTSTLCLLDLPPFADEVLEPSFPNISTFPRFVNLPFELRTAIWQQTLPSRRNLDFPTFTTTINLRQGARVGTLPIALFICTESRSVAFKTYHIVKLLGGSVIPPYIACIAPSKDLIHLPYALTGQLSFLHRVNTLLLDHPTFFKSITYLEIRSFHWSEHGPGWHNFLELAKHLTSLKELYLDFSSRFQVNVEMGLRWETQLRPAKRQLKGLNAWFVGLRKMDSTRTVPEIFLHRTRRRMVRFGEEDGKDGAFELPDVWGK